MRSRSLGSGFIRQLGAAGPDLRCKETRMPRTAIIALVTALAALPLASCGGKDESQTKVQMKDMDVVDGTATDAMTDLDGVQSEGAAVAMPGTNVAGNATAPAPAPSNQAEAKPADQEAEILSDQ